MKTALSLMLRLILHAVAGRCGRHRQAEQWDVSLGMDRERQLLLAERTARLAICFLAGEARLGGDKHRRAAPVDHRARDRNRAAIYSAR